jgi:hypothetical protein
LDLNLKLRFKVSANLFSWHLQKLNSLIELQAILSPFIFDGKCPGVFVRAWSDDHPDFSFAKRIFACTEEFLD